MSAFDLLKDVVDATGPLYRLAENIGLAAIVVTKFKLSKVQRERPLANIVVSADDTALEQRPKGIEILSVYFTAHILARCMIDYVCS